MCLLFEFVEWQVVMDCALTKESKYEEATELFHHLRVQRQLYGLKLLAKRKAQTFGQAVHVVLENLSGGIPGMS